jgi:hypothetical protein
MYAGMSSSVFFFFEHLSMWHYFKSKITGELQSSAVNSVTASATKALHLQDESKIAVNTIFNKSWFLRGCKL